MQIRKLERSEHEKTRELYEQVFSEDEPRFVDYYYQYKAAKNVIYAAWEEGSDPKIRSMLHLNPCEICWNGEILPISYIVAVATQQEYRHRGLMRRLLTCSLQDLYDQQAPFAFLMPASEKIYTPFGFRSTWKWKWEEEEVLRAAAINRYESHSAAQCSDQQLQELSTRVNTVLRENYTMFHYRTPEYYRNLDREQRASGEELRILMEEENGGMVPVSARCGARENFPPMMARVVNLQAFLQRIKSVDEKQYLLRITDSLLPKNSGTYRILLTPFGGSLIRWEDQQSCPNGQEPETVDIADLPLWLGENDPFAKAMISEVV